MRSLLGRPWLAAALTALALLFVPLALVPWFDESGSAEELTPLSPTGSEVAIGIVGAVVWFLILWGLFWALFALASRINRRRR